MSSGRRKFLVRQSVVVDIGCNCRRPKLSSLFSSSSSSSASSSYPPKPKTHKTSNPFSPSTTTTTTTTTTSSTSTYQYTSSPSHVYSSPGTSLKEKRSKKKGKRSGGGVVEESVAVVKDSDDPYIDFRDSMLQMIVEKEIYAWEDLNDLLHCFLSLNSPYHHDLILQAFAEIWNGVFSPHSTSKPRRALRR